MRVKGVQEGQSVLRITEKETKSVSLHSARWENLESWCKWVCLKLAFVRSRLLEYAVSHRYAVTVLPSPADIYQVCGNPRQYGITHLEETKKLKNNLPLRFKMGSRVIPLTGFLWDVLDRSDNAKQLSSALDLQECLKKALENMSSDFLLKLLNYRTKCYVCCKSKSCTFRIFPPRTALSVGAAFIWFFCALNI